MPKFLLTKELGRLAKWLRILGFDARYEPSPNKAFVMVEALKEDRVVVTRNSRFGTRHGGTIVFVKHDRLSDQLEDLFAATGLRVTQELLFSRCTVCNEPLLGADKAEVRAKVPEYVYATHDAFMTCPRCGRIYWRGTHWGNVREILDKVH